MKYSIKFLLSLTALALLIAAPLSGIANAYSFNQNNIIDDKVFNQTGTMDVNAINNFLNQFPSSCLSTNNGFAANEPVGYNPTNGFMYGNPVSAGQVIYDASQVFGVNPQVLLSTLQKEEGTVVGNGPYGCSALALSAAAGYACTDSGTASHSYVYTNGTDPGTLATPLFYSHGSPVTSVTNTCVNTALKTGFSEQVIRAAWLLEFGLQRSEGNVNWAVIKGNWDNSDDPQSCYGGPMTQGTWVVCPSGAATYYDGYTTIDGTAVHMDDGATAALYWYTPHFSGNQSFFNIFTGWFGSPYFTINITYPGGGDSIDSSGGVAVVPVRLTSPPLSTVVLNYGVSDPSVAKILGNSSLTFTTSNWYIPQDLTVQGAPYNTGTHDFLLQVLYINSPDGSYSQSVTPFLNSQPMLWQNTSEQAVYRLYNSTTGQHAYAVNNSVVSSLESNGYTMEETLGYQCQGSTNTPLVVDNSKGLVRNIDSPDITDKQAAEPTILFSNASGSIFVSLLKNTAGNDSLLSNNPSEISTVEQNGWSLITSFLLCNQNIVPVYRLNDSSHSAHFYTTSTAEAAQMIGYGFTYEGLGFYSNTTDTVPVYRLYDPYKSAHFYTTSQAESSSVQSIGYKYEGVGFYAGSSSLPVYRLYDPSSDTHFYTTSQAESNMVQSAGFKYEGIGFYLN